MADMEFMHLDNYITSLGMIFSKIVKTYNRLRLDEYDKKTIDKGNTLLTYGVNLLADLKSHVGAIETLLTDCSNFIEEVEEELAIPAAGNYVFLAKNGKLSYAGKVFPKKNIVDTNCSNTSCIAEDKFFIKEINHSLNVGQVQSLDEIPPSIYEYSGGLYMRLPDRNIVQIPFPAIIDSKREHNRTRSIRCKHISHAECGIQRDRMSRIYNAPIRHCNFAHTGENIIKIGHPARCPGAPDFGNSLTLNNDIRDVSLGDIKNMLMYGLNDVALAAIWLNHYGVKNQIYINLDKV